MKTVTSPETGTITNTRAEDLYHVIILNDDEHSYEYVIEMLQSVFGISYSAAVAHTTEADSTGSSIVMTCGLEEAERRRDGVRCD